jgi:DNA-binding Lrp family transcriptional regulator
MPIAFVFINSEPKAMPFVLEEVKKIREVDESAMVYGNFDIMAKVRTETMKNLKQVISWRIRTLPKVLSTVTTLVVEKE